MDSSKAISPKSFDPKVLLLAILLLAFIVRIWGVGFGLPYLYHADEPNVVNRALAYSGGDLNPHYFKIPPLVSYFLFSLYGIFFLVMRLLGKIPDVANFAMMFLKDPTPFYLIGRIVLGVLFGTLTVYSLFQLVRKNFSLALASLAALFLALNFLHVQNSHYIYLDIPLLLILVLCFFPILNILRESKAADYWKFGALAGLAFATKYNGVFIVVPFLVAHFLSQQRLKELIFNKRLLYAFFAALICYSIANPYTWLDAPSFFSGLFSIGQHQGTVGFSHHLTYSLNEAMGLPLLVLSILGLMVSVIRWERYRLPIAAFVIAYYIVLAQVSQPHDRYVLPLIPFLLFFAADFLLFLQMHFNIRRALFAIIIFAALSPCIVKVLLSDYLISREDVRTKAVRWIESEIPQGSKIALGERFFLPRLRPTLEQLESKKRAALQQEFASMKQHRIDWMIQQAQSSTAPRYELFFMADDGPHEFLFATPRIPFDLDELKREGIEYAVVTRISPLVKPAFFDSLRQNAKLIRRFSPYKDSSFRWPINSHPLTGTPSLWQELLERERNGQIIEIFKLSE